MTGEAFYAQFKAALKFFDLKWSEMDKMEVSIRPLGISFSYDDRTVIIKIREG